MLHIILLVLKILGIILLSILGLVVLLILALLFVPVRYKVYFSVEEYGRVQCNVSWLLHIISLKLKYDKKFQKSIRIFGIDIGFFKILKKKGLKKPKKLRGRKKAVKHKKNLQETKKSALEGEERERMVSTENDDITYDNFSYDKTEFTQKENDFDEEDTKKSSILYKIKNKISKIPVLIKKIIYQTKNICGKIKSVHQKTGSAIGFLKDEETKEAIEFIKKQLGFFLKDVKPRKITGHLTFGTGDAASTGELLGAYYLITKGISRHFKVTPDFDHKVLEGNMKIKGRVFIYKLLIIGFKVYKNKNLKERIDTGKSLV